jgi:hypothetical protein
MLGKGLASTCDHLGWAVTGKNAAYFELAFAVVAVYGSRYAAMQERAAARRKAKAAPVVLTPDEVAAQAAGFDPSLHQAGDNNIINFGSLPTL